MVEGAAAAVGLAPGSAVGGDGRRGSRTAVPSLQVEGGGSRSEDGDGDGDAEKTRRRGETSCKKEVSHYKIVRKKY